LNAIAEAQMQGKSTSPSNAVDALAIAQACQDHYIAQRLPAWMAKLTVADYRLLSQALSQLLACREGLTQALAQVRNLD
ncbi:hypothetical protein KC221_30165, partial [Mycobacterium tuberculosis]|nr:hypothetical protein [Mycobacterium tuberculosis]